jgi:hypothetical protein
MRAIRPRKSYRVCEFLERSRAAGSEEQRSRHTGSRRFYQSSGLAHEDWGRSTRIDSWERLRLAIELMKSGLPVDISIDLNDAEVSRRLPLPLPYDPGGENSMLVPAPLPILAEVRVSLWIDEMLAWLLPVQFCVDQLLTVEEVVTKLADAFRFLKAWSQIHAGDAREYIRTQRSQTQHPAKPASNYLVQ